MESEHYSRPQKQEFTDLVMEHLRAILVISRLEYHGGYWENVSRGDSRTERVYVPDTRASYIQCVQSLADILLPYFDKKMKDVSKKLEEEITKEYNRLKKNTENIENTREKLSIFKQEKMRIMFQELNLLLHRQSYLKSAIYSEEEEEEVLKEEEGK